MVKLSYLDEEKENKNRKDYYLGCWRNYPEFMRSNMMMDESIRREWMINSSFKQNSKDIFLQRRHAFHDKKNKGTHH